jgi:hypothetical protein
MPFIINDAFGPEICDKKRRKSQSEIYSNTFTTGKKIFAFNQNVLKIFKKLNI